MEGAPPVTQGRTHTQPLKQGRTQPVAQRRTQPVAQRRTQPVAQSRTQPVAQSRTQPVAQRRTQPLVSLLTVRVPLNQRASHQKWVKSQKTKVPDTTHPEVKKRLYDEYFKKLEKSFTDIEKRYALPFQAGFRKKTLKPRQSKSRQSKSRQSKSRQSKSRQKTLRRRKPRK